MRSQILGMLLIVFSSLTALAHKSDFQDSLKSYYKHKQRAEMNIVYGKNDSALLNFALAFSYKSPFCIDLYNAFLLTSLVDDRELGFKFANKLAEYGLEKRFLEDDFRRLLIKKSFQKRTLRDYDKHFNSFLNSGRYQSGQEFLAIAKRDQDPRLVSVCTRDSVSKEKIDSVYSAMNVADSLNLLELEKFCQSKGFPGFERLGFADPFRPMAYSMGTVYMLWWHNRNSEDTDPGIKLLRKLGIEAVYSGEFVNTDYAFLYDCNEPEFPYYYQMIALKTGSPEISFKAMDESDSVIDARRAELYLEPIAEYRKKLIFMANNHTYCFFSFASAALIFTRMSKFN